MPAIFRIFLYFLYFKIASSIYLEEGFGLVASAIYAATFEIAELMANVWISVQTNPYEGQFKSVRKVTVQLRVLLFVLAVPVGILIAIGFAPSSIGFESSRWLDNAINHPFEWFAQFCLLMLLPLVVSTVFPRKIVHDYPFDNWRP